MKNKSLILELLNQYCIVTVEKNACFFQGTCFKESNNMVVRNNLRVRIYFHEKYYLPVIIWNKKFSSKQVAPIINTPEKNIAAAVL